MANNTTSTTTATATSTPTIINGINVDALGQRILTGELKWSGMTAEEQKAYKQHLDPDSANGSTLRVQRPNEITIDKVKLYATPIVDVKDDKGKVTGTKGGAIHFQGAPGTNQKYGATFYKSFFVWLIDNQDTILAWVNAQPEGTFSVKVKADSK